MAAQKETAPPPPKYIIFDDFSGGMNTQFAREDLPEKALAWIENLQPIAKNKLQGVPGPADKPLTTFVSKTIVRQFYFDLGASIDYIINFGNDGSCTAVQNPGGTNIQIAPAGTFSSTGADAANWLGQRILFADSVAGYCTWDGNIFVQQGGMSPNIIVTAGGSGYSNPVASSSGGSGTGDTYSVQQNGGVVTGVTLLTPGKNFKATDTITLTISDSGGGIGSGATANAHVWPFISPAPTTVAVAFGRVWLAQGKTLICGGTGSSTFGDAYDDFTTADASVTLIISDSDLIHQITALRYLEGTLYIWGDNSVKFIASITVSSGVTNFTITPLTSDQGTTYPQSIVSFNRLVLFANSVGVFAIFGASVEKISDPMDGVFQKINFAAAPLSAGVIDLNNIHTFALLVQYQDPELGLRSLILCYANQKWNTANQGMTITSIVTAFINGQTYLFGAETVTATDNEVLEFFTSTDQPVDYKVSTSLTSHGNPVKNKRVQRAGVGQTVSAVSDLVLMVESEYGETNAGLAEQFAQMTIQNSLGQNLTITNSSGGVLQITGTGFVASRSGQLSQTGTWIGATATGSLNGIQIQAIFLEYTEGALWGKQ